MDFTFSRFPSIREEHVSTHQSEAEAVGAPRGRKRNAQKPLHFLSFFIGKVHVLFTVHNVFFDFFMGKVVTTQNSVFCCCGGFLG